MLRLAYLSATVLTNDALPNNLCHTGSEVIMTFISYWFNLLNYHHHICSFFLLSKSLEC